MTPAEELRALAEAIVAPGGRGPRWAVLRIEAPGLPPLEAAAGVARPDTGEAMSTSHPFHVASVGKLFTAALVLQVAEAGGFGPDGVDTRLGDLDDAIGAVLPAGVVDRLVLAEGHALGRRVTLRHLLSHTSGMPDQVTDDASGTARALGHPAPASFLARWWEAAQQPDGAFARRHWDAWDRARPDDPDAGTLNRYLAHRLGERPAGRPGQQFHYSDTGYQVLGVVLEAVTGRPYHRLQRERISGPLGLGSTYLAYRDDPSPEAREREAELWFEGVPVLCSGLDVSFDWAGGGQVSTVADLSRFLRALLDGALFAGPAALRAMTTTIRPEGLVPPWEALGLGVHTWRSPGGRALRGHAGFWGVRLFEDVSTGAVLAGATGVAEPGPWLDALAGVAERVLG